MARVGDRRQWLLLGHELADSSRPRLTTSHQNESVGASGLSNHLLLHEHQSSASEETEVSQNSISWDHAQPPINKRPISSHLDLENDGLDHQDQRPSSPYTYQRSQGISALYRTASDEHLSRDPWEETQTSLYSGWRGGVRACFLACIFCFIVEFVLLLVAMKIGGDSPIGTLHTGSCSSVKTLTFWLLVPLNIVGTVLIGSSNYVMQCLCAPNRQEVDSAHQQSGYVNIGTPSMSNLLRVSHRKHALWWIIGLSTIPVHLFLNSTIFGSLQANDYGVLIVSNDFQHDETWDTYCGNLYDPQSNQSASGEFACLARMNILNGNATYTRLDSQSCIKEYGNSLLSTRSNLMLVTNNTGAQWPNLSRPRDKRYDTTLKFNETSGEANLLANKSGVPSRAWPTMNYTTRSGLFTESGDDLWNVDSFHGIFTAFDFRFWTSMQLLDYDFQDKRIPEALKWEPTSWMCPTDDMFSGRTCSRKSVRASDWRVTPQRISVDHCISASGQEQCHLQYSQTMLIIVVICDAVKVASILVALRYALRTTDEDAPLITLGDAVESFLKNPDPTTRRLCLIDERYCRDRLHCRSKLNSNPTSTSNLIPKVTLNPFRRTYKQIPHDLDVHRGRGIKWIPHRYRWKDIPSLSRWLVLILWFIGLFIGAIVILQYSLRVLREVGITNIWAQGIGTIDPNAVFANSIFSSDGTEDKVLRNAIILNLPQIFFSFLYFVCNGAVTCMVTGREWGTFGTRARTLRVTIPRGQQRSTYWLSLPWRYSVPLTLASAGTHWLVSRSLFLVRVDVYSRDGVLSSDQSVSACGFSPLAITLVMVMLAVMSIFIAGMAMKRLSSHIPTVGTCSFAISAACHCAPSENNPSLKPLMWGEIDKPTPTEPGHCGLSSRRRHRPMPGILYA